MMLYTFDGGYAAGFQKLHFKISEHPNLSQ